MRFLGLSLSDTVPDAKTIWLFREQLTQAKLIKKLFDQFDDFLRKNGFSAKKGQIIDLPGTWTDRPGSSWQRMVEREILRLKR